MRRESVLIIMMLGEQAWNKNSSWQIVSWLFRSPSRPLLLHFHPPALTHVFSVKRTVLNTEPPLTSPIGSSALSVAAHLFSMCFPSSFIMRGLYSPLSKVRVMMCSGNSGLWRSRLLCVWSHNCGSVKGERDIEDIGLFPNIKEEKLSIPVISIDIRKQ